MAKVLKKRVIDADVLTKARERIAHVYDLFDTIVVSFSGGKDSTAILNLTLDEARRRGKLPLQAFFYDEEAIHPETIEYVERVAKLPEIDLKWFCVPVKHRNGCSRRAPWWYPWAPEDEAKWVRPLPARAIRAFPGYSLWPVESRQSVPELNPHVARLYHGTVGMLTGVRADESLRRYMSVSHEEVDNYIAYPGVDRYATVKPIYDWTTEDVWLAPSLFGWDYNRAYDVQERAGIGRNSQRVAPPYGEEPMQRLWMYAVCWPHLWDKMTARVPGARTAARYSTSDIYGFGGVVLPDGRSWQDMVGIYLARHAAKERVQIAARLKRDIEVHFEKTSDPIPEERAHPMTGASWKYLAMIASRGDLKGRRAMSNRMDRDLKAAIEEALVDDTDGGTRW